MIKKLTTLILLTVLLSGCNFSKGVKADLTTGLKYSYNGFGIDEAKVFCNGSPAKSRNYPEGSILKIELHGIRNYEVENGKISPGCSIVVTDEEQNIVLQSDDLFKGVEVSKEQFAVPNITVTFGNSFSAGKKYTLNAHFYDKKKPENVIDIEQTFDVTPKGS